MPMRKIRFSGVLLLAVFVSLCSAISGSEIQRLAKVMNWKAGQVIADVGAGEGEIGFAAAGVVGENGKVYLTELDEEKLAALQKDANRRKLKNVVVLAAAEKETKLPTTAVTPSFFAACTITSPLPPKWTLACCARCAPAACSR